MELKLTNNFLYRVLDKNLNLNTTFNAFENGVFRNNDKLNLYLGEVVKINVSNKILHIVKPTETIEKIAEKYNVDVEKLKLENAVTNKVFIGQKILISKD